MIYIILKEPINYRDDYTHEVTIISCDLGRQAKHIKQRARDLGYFTTIRSTINTPRALYNNPNYLIVYEGYFPELPDNSGWLLGYDPTPEQFDRLPPAMPSLTVNIHGGP